MTPVYDGYPVSAVEALIDHQIAGRSAAMQWPTARADGRA